MKISLNKKTKNAFTSLRMNRVAEEEIIKYNNNSIHYTYSTMENKILYKNNNKLLLKNHTANKNLNGSNDMNLILPNTTTMTKNKNSSNILDTYEYKIKQHKQKNKNSIDRIVINLYSRKTEKDEYIKENDNINENGENKNENNEYENSKNNDMNEKDAINIVKEIWIKENQMSNKINFGFLGKKRNNNIYNKIKKEINFNFIKNIYNKNNNWEYKIKKENINYFSINKSLELEKFIYSEINYIKDLTKTYSLPKDYNNNLYIISYPSKHQIMNKINFKTITPKNKNELESELYNYYIETKNENNYFSNIDNNEYMEEQKIKPIYVLSQQQIFKLYNGINKDKNKDESKNIMDDSSNININNINNTNNNIFISKKEDNDYEIVEVYTPRINKDNNTNRTIKTNSNMNNSEYNNNSKNENNNKINNNSSQSEINKNNSQDFGQYTPLSMLNDKFIIFATSRNIKYCVPESQGFFNFVNYNKYGIKFFKKENLKKNKFSLNIERCDTKDKMKKKPKNKNEIDYSKFSSNS